MLFLRNIYTLIMESPNAESTQANQSETDLMLIKRIVWNVDMQRKIHKHPLPSMWYLSTKNQMFNQKQLTLQLLNNLPDTLDSPAQQTQQQCTANKQKIYFEDFSQIYSLEVGEQQSQEKTLAQINTELGQQCQKLTMQNKKLVQQLNEYRLKQIENDSNYRSEYQRKKTNYQYCNNYIKYLEQQIQRHKNKPKNNQPLIEQPYDDQLRDWNEIEEENRKLKNRLAIFERNLSYLKSMGIYQSEEIKRLKGDKEEYKRRVAEINNQAANVSNIKDGNNQLITNNSQTKFHLIPLKQDTRVHQPIASQQSPSQHRDNIQNTIQQLIDKNKQLEKNYKTARKNEESLRVVVRLLQNQFEKLNKHLQRLRKSSNNASQQI